MDLVHSGAGAELEGHEQETLVEVRLEDLGGLVVAGVLVVVEPLADPFNRTAREHGILEGAYRVLDAYGGGLRLFFERAAVADRDGRELGDPAGRARSAVAAALEAAVDDEGGHRRRQRLRDEGLRAHRDLGFGHDRHDPGELLGVALVVDLHVGLDPAVPHGEQDRLAGLVDRHRLRPDVAKGPPARRGGRWRRGQREQGRRGDQDEGGEGGDRSGKSRQGQGSPR